MVNPDGSPALGPDRPTSGICGAPIRTAALEFVRSAREAIDRLGLGLTLIGVGGVSGGQHVVEMLAAGADFVQSATGMMWNPLLAHEYHTLVAAAAAAAKAAAVVAGKGAAVAVPDGCDVQQQQGGEEKKEVGDERQEGGRTGSAVCSAVAAAVGGAGGSAGGGAGVIVV